MESSVSHYAKIKRQINSTCTHGNLSSSSSSSGMSSDCEVVQKELRDHTSMLSSQIESCQQVLSLNTSQLENQNAEITSLKTANQQLLSWLSIIEAGLFAQEAKSSEIEQQNAKLSQIKDTLSKLLKKDAANTFILDKLQSKTCQCTGPHQVSSSYTTNRAASIPSSSGTSDDHSEINLFNARPPVCTFEILTPDNSGRPLAGSILKNHQDF